MLSNCVQAIALDLAVALVARRRNESLETVLAIELSFFLDEADVLKRTAALGVNADKMIGAPDLSQSGDERPSDVGVAVSAHGYTRARSDSLIQDTPSTFRRAATGERSALGTRAAEATDSRT